MEKGAKLTNSTIVSNSYECHRSTFIAGPTAEKHPFLAADQLDHHRLQQPPPHVDQVDTAAAHAHPPEPTTASGVVRLTPSWEERPNLGS